MCFPPQRCTLFQHPKWSENGVVCLYTVCWLWNVVHAAAVCDFSFLIWPHGSTPAALASLLYRPSWPQNHCKNTLFGDFPNISRARMSLLCSDSFSFSSLLFPSLLVSSRLFPSLLVSSRLFSSLLFFSFLFFFFSFFLSSLFYSSLLFSSLLFSSLLFSSLLFSSLLFSSLLFSPHCQTFCRWIPFDDARVDSFKNSWIYL